ncbi:hypothetical protein [Chryseobacterium gossypii]|uniref:hypothetical protein n=1 Tax=Chryseobacterium gossypii TaxID=3231602 RepID=UPI003524DC6A
MKKILLLSGILTVCFGYSQKSFEAYKDFSALSGTWKTEVEGSPLILQIREAGKTFRFSLINVNKEEFIIDESELSSPAPSEYEVKVKKAYFIQYTDCSIKNARIHLKKLEDGKLAFSYISDETYCSFGNDNEIDISDIEDLIFTK